FVIRAAPNATRYTVRWPREARPRAEVEVIERRVAQDPNFVRRTPPRTKNVPRRRHFHSGPTSTVEMDDEVVCPDHPHITRARAEDRTEFRAAHHQLDRRPTLAVEVLECLTRADYPNVLFRCAPY